MICIQNTTLVLTDHYVRNGTVICDGNKITYCGEHIDTPAGAQEIDAKGLYTGPGLIDIHLHAGNGVMFYDACVEPARFMLEHGATSILPTLYFTMGTKEMSDSIRFIRSFIGKEETPNIRGIYVEGPYMNPEYGCSKNDIKWADEILPEEYMPVLEAAQQDVKVWGLAPERAGIEKFCADAKKIYPGAVFSVAHSTATPEQVAALFPMGLKLSTHHTNATGTIPHWPECRGVCVDEAVNYNDCIYAELISDEYGVHVHPYMQRLIRKIKGRERLILITDSTFNDGPPLEGLEHITDIYFDHGGDIAGSKLTIDAACRNFMMHTGASLCDVFYLASHNPAQMLGWTNKGDLRVGGDADLIIVDAEMNVKNVICNGKLEK
ncbi:MAG: amidohydrolase family protein [Oscillospiraceae bacterium]|nr:amidohydrolase family protein [Oscillospiraceae bacterium]MBR2977048.1 amidohydrolase family protein [Oscillospiraceae bacterium]